nr:uncharacterized protein LOC113718607 [Coffea arabica]
MALISDRLLRHPNTDVRISVMSCICEVLRISSPHQPYENERMKLHSRSCRFSLVPAMLKLCTFLKSLRRFNHPQAVFSYMEDIMTWLLDESDDIPLGLLKPILASVQKENQERVLKNCSTKVRSFLMNAVKLMRLDINDYADIVASLCREMPAGDNVVLIFL